MSRARQASAKIRSPPHAAPQIARSPGPAPACVNVSTIASLAIDSLSAGNRGCFRPGASIMCPLKSKTVPGIAPESSFDIAGPSRFLPPAILTIFSCAGYRGHRLHQKRRSLILFSFVIRSLFEPGRGLINPKRVMYLAMSALRSRAEIETGCRRSVSQKANAARTSRIAGPPLEQNLNVTRSETEHAELLLADLVGRVDRLRLAKIGDRLGATAQQYIGEASVVVGLDIGRTELDRLRVICNRAAAVTLCDVGLAAGVESVEVLGVYRDRLVIVGDRVIDLAQRLFGIAAIPVRHAVPWIDADRLIIVGDRAAIVFQAFVCHAAAVVPGGIFGFALDDFAAIRNGEVVLAIVAVGNAARAVQPKQIWIELDCLAVVCDRRLPSAFFRDQPLPEECLTPLAETKGVFRIDCDRLG